MTIPPKGCACMQPVPYARAGSLTGRPTSGPHHRAHTWPGLPARAPGRFIGSSSAHHTPSRRQRPSTRHTRAARPRVRPHTARPGTRDRAACTGPAQNAERAHPAPTGLHATAHATDGLHATVHAMVWTRVALTGNRQPEPVTGEFPVTK